MKNFFQKRVSPVFVHLIVPKNLNIEGLARDGAQHQPQQALKKAIERRPTHQTMLTVLATVNKNKYQKGDWHALLKSLWQKIRTLTGEPADSECPSRQFVERALLARCPSVYNDHRIFAIRFMRTATVVRLRKWKGQGGSTRWWRMKKLLQNWLHLKFCRSTLRFILKCATAMREIRFAT